MVWVTCRVSGHPDAPTAGRTLGPSGLGLSPLPISLLGKGLSTSLPVFDTL